MGQIVLTTRMNFVEKLLKRSKLSQYAYAKKLGISLQSLQYILGVTAKPRSRKSMDLRLLVKLKRESGMSAKAFFDLIEREFGD